MILEVFNPLLLMVQTPCKSKQYFSRKPSPNINNTFFADFRQLSMIHWNYYVGQIRTLEIQRHIYQNHLFCLPLVCFWEKKIPKKISSITSMMALTWVGAISDSADLRVLFQKTGRLVQKTSYSVNSGCQCIYYLYQHIV